MNWPSTQLQMRWRIPADTWVASGCEVKTGVHAKKRGDKDSSKHASVLAVDSAIKAQGFTRNPQLPSPNLPGLARDSPNVGRKTPRVRFSRSPTLDHLLGLMQHLAEVSDSLLIQRQHML